MSSVLCLRGAGGIRCFVKHYGDPARYRAELAAYRTWVPALEDAAPSLRAFDTSLRAMILSAVPGNAAPWPACEVSGPDITKT